MAVLHLVPIFCGTSRDLLDPLAARIGEVFGLSVQQHPPSFDPELAFDSSRGQYNSRMLLAQLLQYQSKEADRILGITGVDLFIPVLTYVFGEAQLDGRAAVVSTYRLDAELYGLAPDPELLFARLVKEAVHELGHTYNLIHCPNQTCVMTSSTYVENIDLKSERFCNHCHTSLHEALARSNGN